MFDDDGALEALTAQSQLLQPQAPAKPSTFQGSWAAAAKAIPAAAVETTRLFNQIASPPKMTDEKRQQLYDTFGADFAAQEQKSNAEVLEGVADRNKELGAAAKSFTPDPQSSGSAAQIIHGVTKTLTKVGIYGLAGGIPAISAGLSADEGTNESLRLQDAGVDPITANKAGLVRAGTTLVSTALPAAGGSIAATVGLAAAAGPGSFMADQAGIKHILDTANYHDKAAEYDPFDVTGLLLSIMPGAVVGGIATRARIKGVRATEAAALRDTQDAAATAKATDAATVTANAEREAAARVAQTDNLLQRKALTPPEDLAGQIYHQRAVETVARQLDEGVPVEVRGVPERPASADITSLENLANTRMLDDQGAKLEAERVDLLPTAGNVADPGAVSALREQIASLEQTKTAITDDSIKARAKEIQAAEQVSYKQALSRANKEGTTRAADLDSRIAALEEQVGTNRNATQAAQRLAEIDQHLSQIREQRAAIGVPTPGRGALAIKQALADFSSTRPADTATVVSGPKPIEAVQAPAARETNKAFPATEQPKSATAQPVSVAVADIPEIPMVIGHDDAGTPITATPRELIEDARAQEAIAQKESTAYEAAINCFLSFGDTV
jgi:hypothetical protein